MFGYLFLFISLGKVRRKTSCRLKEVSRKHRSSSSLWKRGLEMREETKSF